LPGSWPEDDELASVDDERGAAGLLHSAEPISEVLGQISTLMMNMC